MQLPQYSGWNSHISTDFRRTQSKYVYFFFFFLDVTDLKTATQTFPIIPRDFGFSPFRMSNEKLIAGLMILGTI